MPGKKKKKKRKGVESPSQLISFGATRATKEGRKKKRKKRREKYYGLSDEDPGRKWGFLDLEKSKAEGEKEKEGKRKNWVDMIDSISVF